MKGILIWVDFFYSIFSFFFFWGGERIEFEAWLSWLGIRELKGIYVQGWIHLSTSSVVSIELRVRCVFVMTSFVSLWIIYSWSLRRFYVMAGNQGVQGSVSKGLGKSV